LTSLYQQFHSNLFKDKGESRPNLVFQAGKVPSFANQHVLSIIKKASMLLVEILILQIVLEVGKSEVGFHFDGFTVDDHADIQFWENLMF
jgi:hypothetical protein